MRVAPTACNPTALATALLEVRAANFTSANSEDLRALIERTSGKGKIPF